MRAEFQFYATVKDVVSDRTVVGEVFNVATVALNHASHLESRFELLDLERDMLVPHRKSPPGRRPDNE